MSTSEKYIQSKIKKDHKKVLIAFLKRRYNSLGGIMGNVVNIKAYLSRSNAYIGLVLLDQDSRLSDNNSSYYISYIYQNSKRYKALAKIAKPNEFWSSGRYSLLESLFGKRVAPYVKQAWDMIPTLMYQSGYERRSFRGSDLDEIYFTTQLNFIINLINESKYNFSLEEYAIYSNNIQVDHFSFVFAAAINSNDKSIKQLFLDATYGRHDVARPSRGIIKAMLLSDCEECWIAVEKLLLSAQRQEGLRQIILECLDETSLGAMKYMIKVMLNHNLIRFSSVVRAIDTWAGFAWEGEKASTVKRFLELADLYLSEPEKINGAVKSADNAEVYMALWAQGVIDVTKCTPLINKVLEGNNDKISLALYFVSQVGISSYSISYGNKYLQHSDLVIVCQAVELVNNSAFIDLLSVKDKATLFSKLESQLERLPKKAEMSKPRVFSWLKFRYSKELLLDLMINLLSLKDIKDIDRIVPYFDSLAVPHREKVCGLILHEYYGYGFDKAKKRPPLSTKKRDFAFSILKDRAESIRSTAIRALSYASLSSSEILIFEGLLIRKSADFRRSIIQLLLLHSDNQIKESAFRLTESKNEDQRLAGLDLLLWLKNNSIKNSKWVQSRVNEFKARALISNKEELVLIGLSKSNNKKVEYSKDNGYGLYDPSSLNFNTNKIKNSTGVFAKATTNNKYGLSKPDKEVDIAIGKLGKIIVENKDYEYTYEDWEENRSTTLLGNTFTEIKRNTQGMTSEEEFCNYPLYEVWRKWFQDSGLQVRDIFLINLSALIERDNIGDTEFARFNKKLLNWVYIPKIPQLAEYQWQNPIYNILSTIGNRYPYEEAIDFLSDLIYILFDSADQSIVSSYKKVETSWQKQIKTWRNQDIITTVWEKYHSFKNGMTDEQFNIYWNLGQWKYHTRPKIVGLEIEHLQYIYDYARAYNNGLISKDILYWRILQADVISDLTKKVVGNQYDIKKEFSFLNEMIEDCRNRILEVELIRGDSSTSVTHLAQSLNLIYGIDNFVKLLKGLGIDTLFRGYIYSYGNAHYNKKEILSTLLKRCFPTAECTQAEFDKLINEAKISQKRLCDAATYSPQWLTFVSNNLGWKNMESAVWWLHAHTNGDHNSQTESEVAKYSVIEISAFREGAVDIDWFKESYKALGKEKWKRLYESAKYISDGGGHKRGLLYADVIQRKTKITEITERINSKRNQDYLRVYGVIPLSKANPTKDILNRYQFLQNFKKESKQFGSQRQASEAIAIRIAMDNLARTAGYPDPIRLQWAMETREAQKIIEDSKDVFIDDTQIVLSIDKQGKSSITAIKGGKRLKSVPAKIKKENSFIKLKQFNKTLREQYRRTRKSLESAMINGDIFTKGEIEMLSNHPVVAPMLKKLVLISDSNLGFWSEGKIISADGENFDLGNEIIIAHSIDLFEAEKWASFQKYCFDNKLVQPFKQIFRELYIPTKDELKENSISRRYAGHQVQPKKTIALLKGQSWTVDYESGLQKVHHKQNTIARMFSEANWFTPADVEAPTIETIEFFNRKDESRLSFENVDKRVFSETMRDIDLVVSVAHVGELDPEASQSSIQLRSVIVEETCRLFKLENVSLLKNHIKIKGELGDYSVHLGSGVCHKVAGTSLSIIPVHSQHRGRIFLPFMDDDPKTAEILSKVILLAKDKEIKDPTILKQL